MVNSRESLSEQSKRRTNYLLLGLGAVLFLVFLLAWCSMQPEEKKDNLPEDPDNFGVIREGQEDGDDVVIPGFSSQGDAQLTITPNELVMDKVIIGSKADYAITLRAENAPLLLKKKELAQKDQKEGFEIGGSCMEKDRLEKDEECLLEISWLPTELRSIQNTLTITWIEDSRSVFKEERSSIVLKAQSTDSKDCVICEDIRKQEEEVDDTQITTTGEEKPLTDEDQKTADCLIKNDEGKIIGICRGELIPLSLKNELLGTVDKSHNVIDANGNKIGKVLGDDTIISSNLNEVIGKAIPSVLTAMKENGSVFGKISVGDGIVSIVDSKGNTVGFPRVDGQVVDTNGQAIGFLSPWGGVIDSMGNFLGVTMPNGSVLNDKNEIVAYMRPMGLAVDTKGILVGGVIPRGVGVGSAGRVLGEVSLNGDVKDSFGQVVGRALLDRSVVDSQMNELGSVVRQGVIIDDKAKLIGFVNSEGVPLRLEKKASKIGYVNPNGTVFAGTNFVGSVMQTGRIIKDGCQQIGSIYPDGSVVDMNLTKLGHMTSTGEAVDKQNQKLGFVAPWGTAIAPGCRLLGLISLDGDVVSVQGMKTGCVNSDRSVQNLQGEKSGRVTSLGPYVDQNHQIIGRVRLDGQIMDNKGMIIGCSYEAMEHPGLIASADTQGVIVDANGFSLGGTFIGDKAYDAQGNWLGNVYFNGWVIGDRGKLIGRVPFSGLVFDDKGQILGSYNQKTGSLVDSSGDKLGRVLPGLSVISLDGKAILGKLIPFGTSFVAMDGTFLGNLRSDGLIVDGSKSFEGTLLANGSVLDKDKKLVGGMISTGPVIASDGKYVGLSVWNGEVVDAQNIKIGRVLPNGLAISDANQVLGRVFPELSVAVSSRGFVGFLEPKILGTQDNPSYQLQVKDTKGNMVGNVSSTGVILGLNNTVAGNLVPICPFIDTKGKMIGWANFEGGVNGFDGRSIGTILPSGLALDSAQNLIASVVDNAVAVDTFGAYLGRLNSHGEVLSGRGEVVARVGLGRFLSNLDGTLIGQILKPGVAVDNNGRFMGWTRYDGQIENGTQVIGQVGLDGHVFDVAGQMIGRYLPLGIPAFNDNEKSVGFLADGAEIMDSAGLKLVRMGYEPFVMNKGNLIARFIEGSDFVTSLDRGEVIGETTNEGTIMPLTSDRAVGSVKMNRMFVSSRQIKGALVPTGLAVTPTLGIIGTEELDGRVFKAGKPSGVVTGMGLVYSPSGELIGSVLKPAVIIDSKGAFVGRSSGTSAVFAGNKQIGNQLTFGAALSSSNDWLGHAMKSGAVVNAHGVYQGAIGSGGLVIGPKNVFAGRVLPDGSVASVSDASVFNTMPYIGHTIEQGIAIEYSGKFSSLGYTTATGDVLDWAEKKIANISDNALALAKKEDKVLPIAHIFPLISAIDAQGNVMGTVMSDGRVVSYNGKVQGKVDNGGRVRLLEQKEEIDQFKILGIVVPEGLVVNDCKVVGQTAYDGRVINGQGVVVGRLDATKWAVDVNGKKIGRVAKNNEPCITEEGKYLGRTLPNSMVVDVNGVPIGCATNSGEMLDSKGNLLCKIVERGPIVDENGNIIGYQDDKNFIWNGGKEPIGTVDWNNKAWDNNGNQIGRGIGVESFFDGGITQNEFGDVKNEKGDVIFNLPPWQETPMNPNGCSGMGDYVLNVGCFKGCDFFDTQGNQLATLMADGTMRDENGEKYATVTPNGEMYAPNGTTMMGKILGLNVSASLKRCGMSGAGAGPNRSVKIGDQSFFVDPRGSVYNEDNEIIGWMGDDGKLYTFNNKPITEDMGGRKPPESKPVDIPKEKLEDFQSRLAEKRKSMREKFGKGTLLIPSPELQARAKPKKDTDWSKVGVNKDSVSTWSVDMTHVILEGKAIPAVLARSIDSRFLDGSALAIVEKNVYGEEGRNILIPAGSRLIGQASTGVNSSTVAKIQINWKRLIRPDGSAFNLDDSTSGDAQGRGGVAAYLDAQLWNKYATPVLSTLATSAVAYMMATNDDVTTTNSTSGQQQQTMSQKAQAANEARKNFIDMIQMILEKMIEEANDVPPVIYVPAGTRLIVFPKKDLWLRSVADDEKDAEKEFGAPSTEAQVPDMDSWAEKRKSEREGQDSSENEENSEQVPSDVVAPIYNGQENMPDLSDRKVTPVTQEDGNMF